MAGCAGIKRDGGRCAVVVGESREYCYQHDPANAEKRRKAASKGGKSKPNREVLDLRLRLQALTEWVISGDLETPRGAVANQLITTRIKLLEYERRAKDIGELVERLEALENGRRAG